MSQSFLLTFIVCTPLPAGAQTTTTEYAGIGVGLWQGEINFEKVEAAGIDIVYIRAGIGDEEDKNFVTNATGAKAADLDVGFYFYVTATTVGEAQTQGGDFASLIAAYDYTGQIGRQSGSERG